MSFSGLNAFRQQQETRSTESKFYKPTQKGQKVQIRPLVELDESSLNYSAKNGTPLFTQEFSNPQKFWLTIVDTRPDEGQCVGWDMVNKYGWFKQDNPDVAKGQHNDGDFNWNPKRWVYIPVLVKESSDDEPRVEVVQLSFNGDAAQSLITFAEDVEEEGGALRSITDRWWTYSRNNGEGFGVRYSITPKDPSDDVNVEDYEVPDLEEFVNRVPYAEQAAFLQLHQNRERSDLSNEPAPAQPIQGSAIATANW